MTTWAVDTSHSNIEFKIRHMAISSVRGRFSHFSGAAQTENGKITAIEAEIDATSIDTNDEKRDEHLRSADFFNVDAHPTITFKSQDIEALGENTYRVKGDLTMNGQTHPVTFEVEVGDTIKDPWGMTRTAATVRGKLKRTDWDLKWNQALEAGGVLVGEEVSFDFDIQATEQTAEAAQKP